MVARSELVCQMVTANRRIPEVHIPNRHAAHLYAVPVLEGFDSVKSSSHCRRSTDDDCRAWRKLRKAGRFS